MTDIFEYLKTPVAISRRVAPASANTVSQTLAILIKGLLERRTWGALFRLLLFPRVALAARKHGDPLPANGPRDALNEKCVFMLRSDIPTILGRLHDATEGARPARKRARQPQREARPDNDRTLASIRALMAEGAPARAVQLLTSDGLHDPDDPMVQRKLSELHPMGAHIVAPLPVSWERKESWGASDIEAMRALLQSFPPGAPRALLVCVHCI